MPTPSAIAGVPASNLLRQLVERGPSSRDRADHLAAGQERRHRLEQLLAAPQRARARSGRRACGPRRRRSRSPAPATSMGRCGADCAPSTTSTPPLGVRPVAELADGLIVPSEFDWWTTATSLTRPLGGDAVERVEVEPAVVVEAQVAQLRARRARQQLPRHQVRVVLHLGRDDHVALAARSRRRSEAHEVERLGRVAREDALARRGRADEAAHVLARALEGLGRLVSRACRRRGGRSRRSACRARSIASSTSRGFCALAAVSR